MRIDGERELALKLIDFLLSFPLPEGYKDILQEQIAKSTFCVEQYVDCFKILFSCNDDVRKFPKELPTLIQGCQILKDTGPLSCQLFVEDGFIVQFEVVDMGLKGIDWNYFWSNKPIYDIDYGS